MDQRNDLPVPPSLRATIGPSFILLGLALGSGELIMWPYLSANWGLGLLWGALLGISFQFILNTEVMRYTLATGESIFVGFRKISKLIPVWFIFSTFIPWSIPGFSSASAQIFSRIIPGLSESAIAITLLLSTGVFFTIGKTLYKTMEMFQKTIIILGLPFIFLLSLFLTHSQDWVQAAAGLIGKGDGWWFFPKGIGLFSFLGAFAYAGAGGNLNLAQSYYIKEKGFGMGKFSEKITSLLSGGTRSFKVEGRLFAHTSENTKKWKQWWKLVNTEHFLVFWLLGFITILLLSVLAKSLVFGAGAESGLSFLYAEANAIGVKSVPFIGTVFLIVASLMLFSTQIGVLESSSRIISENILLLSYKKGKSFPLSFAFYSALWAQIILGIVIYAFGFTEPRLLLTVSAVLNGSAMMVSFPLVYRTNKALLNKNCQTSWQRKAIMIFAFLFFVVFVMLTLNDVLG